MTRWRPGPRWFEANTPKLWAIAQKTSATARVADVMKRHFG
jgi:GST-like protein